MKVFAIGDLHLSTTSEKPMDVFGGNWEGHFEKIKSHWQEEVQEGDVVLIPGDISWAMKLEDAIPDLNEIAKLRGEKVLIRGNHDYWWNGISRVRGSAPDPSFHFLQTDAVKIGHYVFVGSRGWTCPGSQDFTEQDKKLYLRELERFRLALLAGQKLKSDGDKMIALIHYPPFFGKVERSGFCDLFEEFGVEKVVYGHLHGGAPCTMHVEKSGVEYFLTSCDKTGFRLVLIDEKEENNA